MEPEFTGSDEELDQSQMSWDSSKTIKSFDLNVLAPGCTLYPERSLGAAEGSPEDGRRRAGGVSRP